MGFSLKKLLVALNPVKATQALIGKEGAKQTKERLRKMGISADVTDAGKVTGIFGSPLTATYKHGSELLGRGTPSGTKTLSKLEDPIAHYVTKAGGAAAKDVKHADANKVIRGGLLAMQPTRYQYLVGKLTGADKVIDVVQPKGEELGGGNIVTGESSEMSKKRAETGTIGGGGGFGTGKPLSGEELYGQTMGQTGQQIQDIIRRRQGYLDAADPTSTYVRQSANRQVRQARAEAGQAGRTTRGEEAQIRRQAEADIGAQLYENRLRSLGAYQNTISNVARNLATIELGNQSIATGSQMPAPPRGGGLVDGLTVICTELHRQGYLSDEIIEKDAEFGRTIRVESPEVYQGYRLLADPVVVRMQKSKVFTAIVAKVALPWAKWMAGEDNFLGRNINKYGQKLCRFAWHMKEWFHGTRHEQSKA
jgi:hypothetical protein